MFYLVIYLGLVAAVGWTAFLVTWGYYRRLYAAARGYRAIVRRRMLGQASPWQTPEGKAKLRAILDAANSPREVR